MRLIIWAGYLNCLCDEVQKYIVVIIDAKCVNNYSKKILKSHYSKRIVGFMYKFVNYV